MCVCVCVCVLCCVIVCMFACMCACERVGCISLGMIYAIVGFKCWMHDGNLNLRKHLFGGGLTHSTRELLKTFLTQKSC
mgnify:CR=1 FL=1